ncbi:MAG TPA: serine/threonine-protein kinase [Pseudomonadota bacterium]|nr:serine/threonine-protein kinase [Pseudomonadota bacterium]HRI49608.1 serine/threonine-protein kinase [Pseudomonadota bacterium]
MQPQQIGPYRIIRPLGEGGMGAVYEAMQEPIGRRVALKILLPQYAANRDSLQRFFNEARAVNLIEHPSIVQVSDYNQTPDGTAYLVMEYLRGEVLADRLDRMHETGSRLPLEDVLQISAQIASALAAAHAKSVIHRDLKPSNVMLVRDSAVPRGERVKVLDFGIAKLLQGQAKETAPNAVMGTPQYMSPEQCRGAGGVDEKTDVYALGLMIFEMVAGRPPFIAEMPIEYIGQHAFREPPPLQSFAPTISDKLASFVHSLLVKDKALRPLMRDVEAELAAQIEQLPATAPLLASEPIIDDSGETRRYLPPQEPPPPAVDASGKTLTPPRRRRTHLLVGLGAAGALALVVIVWASYPQRSRPARVVTGPPPAPAPVLKEPPVKGPPETKPEAASDAIDEAPPLPSIPAVGESAPVHSAVNVAETLRKAQAAFDKKQYAKVISLALPVALRNPGRAWRLVGSSACKLRDLKRVNDAYRHLDAAGKKYLVIVCAVERIQLVDSQLRFQTEVK